MECSALHGKREREEKKKNNASVMERLDDSVVGLGLSCPAVPVLGQIFSTGAELADFY